MSDGTKPPRHDDLREVRTQDAWHCTSPDEKTRKLHGVRLGKPCCGYARKTPLPKLYSRLGRG